MHVFSTLSVRVTKEYGKLNETNLIKLDMFRKLSLFLIQTGIYLYEIFFVFNWKKRFFQESNFK